MLQVPRLHGDVLVMLLVLLLVAPGGVSLGVRR